MDPIRPKVVDGNRRVALPASPRPDPEGANLLLPQDGVAIAPSSPTARLEVTQTPPSPRAPKTESQAAKPAEPSRPNQQTPTTLFFEETVSLVPPPQGPTLFEQTVEAARALDSPPKALPSPPASPARRAGVLRKLSHGLLKFLTPDPLQPFQQELESINRLGPSMEKLLTPEQFADKTAEFKARLEAGEPLSSLRVDAYAVARRATEVALKLKPYDCQVLGALAMDDSHIAEMKTGEGKTLTAVMPLYLNALAGQGAHLVTVNDTLAHRDAEEMRPVYALLGMQVGVVLEGMKPEEKRAGYQADITYTTDRALGFDYLRDQTAKNPAQKVQREPFFALIDEVDEVLIDEARSPLIISQKGDSAAPHYQIFNTIVADLKAGSDYFFDRKQNTVWLDDSGYARVENRLSVMALENEIACSPHPQRMAEVESELARRQDLEKLIDGEQAAVRAWREMQKQKPDLLTRWRGAEWDDDKAEALKSASQDATSARSEAANSLPDYGLFSSKADQVRFLQAALKAHALFDAGKDYTVSAGKVEIVDENKGRTSDGRRYNDGVHQALEAKEGVPIGEEQHTVASITYPNLFKMYPRLAGMSGTAKTSESEFLKLYQLDVVEVPPNKPVIRVDEPDLIFRTLEEKYEALTAQASADFFDGKPVLIGTLSVEHNQYVAKKLLQKGVPADSLQVLNAETVRGDKEGENEMIGQAGRSGVITVATNLAGRGANIKPDLINFRQLSEKVAKAHQAGLPVLVTVDKKSEADWLRSWLGESPQVVSSDTRTGPGAGQIQIRYGKEGESDKPQLEPHTLELRGKDFPTGGLTVYGSERSNSRRIDDQLIGRAGRQGAPGRSRFYLSLEDDLLRIFGGNALVHLTEPGVGLDGETLSRVVGQAQSAVESDHFQSREAANKKDDVLDLHRSTYFSLRDEILSGGRPLKQRLNDLVGNQLLSRLREELGEEKSFLYGDLRSAQAKIEEALGFPLPLAFLTNPQNSNDTTISAPDLEAEVRDLVARQTDKIVRAFQTVSGRGEEAFRPLLLEQVDAQWSEHLEQMALLHQSVQWQSLAQKDPEVEFKLQAFQQFESTLKALEERTTSNLYKDLVAFSQLVASGN